jgi:hypothetical protein
MIKEALANQINWGDSLVGRLLNSILRKAGIGIDLIKIDKVIERLRVQFDILKDQIKIKNDVNSFKKLFYFQVSLLLGMLIEEFDKSETSKDEVIKISKSIRFQISVLDAPDEETKKDKLEVIDKLKEFIGKIDVLKDGNIKDTKGDDTKDNGVKVDVIQKSPEMEELKKIVTIFINNSDIKDKREILSLSKSNIGSDIALKNMNTINITQTKAGDSDDKLDLNKLVNQSIDNLNKMKNSEEWKGYDIDSFIEKIKEFQKNNDLSGLLKYLSYLINLKTKTQSSSKKEVESDALAVSEKQKFIKGYSDFINENQLEISASNRDDKEDDIEDVDYEDVTDEKEQGSKNIEQNKRDSKKIEQEEKNIKLIFEEIFTKEYMKKYDVDEDDIKKLDKELVSEESTSITIDPIIEILKIFNRAYKIHTPGIIPSGRSGGKVSNSVFTEYEYVGDSGSGGTPDSPGAGPYRNKVTFNKWESAVLDIIKDPEYQQIFNQKTYFHFSPADPRFNTSKDRKEGGGKSLLKMINELLDGGRLYRSGAQQKFISEYFDVQVDPRKLGFNAGEVDKIAKTASKQKLENKLSFRDFDSLKGNTKIERNFIFRRETKKGGIWYFKVLEVKDKDVFFLLTNGFPYDINLKKKVEELSDTGPVWFGYTDDFKSGVSSRVEVDLKKEFNNFNKGDILDWKGKIEVLCDSEESIFRGDSNMKSPTQKKKTDKLKDEIDKNEDWRDLIKSKK